MSELRLALRTDFPFHPEASEEPPQDTRLLPRSLLHPPGTVNETPFPQEHAAVTRRVQAMAMEKARLDLAWARSRQAGHVSAAGREEAGQENVVRRVERNLMDALQEAVDYSDKANARLDRPERYRHESRRQWKRCRGR